MSEQIMDPEELAPETGPEDVETPAGRPQQRRLVTLGAAALILLLLALAGALWLFKGRTAASGEKAGATEKADEHGAEEGREVKLAPEAMTAAGLEIEGVTQRPAVALLQTTGTVEANPQQTQSVTPLVGGRVERVNVAIGDRVAQGAAVAVIASPAIAQMHGKLHEAETRYALAQRNLTRVQRSENRVAVLQAKARLNEADAALGRTKRAVEANILAARARLSEAEATRTRTQRLIELGAGAGKDLVAAEANYKVAAASLASALASKEVVNAEANYQTAQAEYNFQSNISLNRELQEAQAEVETARVDVKHIRDELTALGVAVPVGERDDHKGDTALITLRAPASGVITQRLVNDGAGVEAGQTLLTIGNFAAVWIIAQVPEASVGLLRPGTPAEVRSAALEGVWAGRINYIDPQLNEETRTARVRVEVANPGERLKAGMFVNLGFQAGSATGDELMIPSLAVQRMGEKNIVFVPKDDEPGAFEVREVELGGETSGYHRVVSGLKAGEKVVAKGSFVLKTQMMKGELGEHDH
jgi:RND family efflux transporter MFP subunit